VQQLGELLDPQGQPARTGDAVRRAFWEHLDHIRDVSATSPQTSWWKSPIMKIQEVLRAFEKLDEDSFPLSEPGLLHPRGAKP
jgi:hypothetical protein